MATTQLTPQGCKKGRTAYIEKFITSNRAAALATVSAEGTPQVAVVYCVVRPECKLYFSTRVESRKYQNITQNPTVSLAFTNEVDLATVQLTGTAQRVNMLKLEQDILYELVRLRYGEPDWPVPPLKMFERGSTNELAIVEVKPFEMTYGSFTTNSGGRYVPFFEKIM